MRSLSIVVSNCCHDNVYIIGFSPFFTAPTGFDRVVTTEINSRYIVISWDEPAAANGILVNYTVLQGGVVIVAMPPSVTAYNITSLRPFTSYNFSVQACTSVGCVESPSLVAMTTEDGRYLCYQSN